MVAAVAPSPLASAVSPGDGVRLTASISGISERQRVVDTIRDLQEAVASLQQQLVAQATQVLQQLDDLERTVSSPQRNVDVSVQTDDWQDEEEEEEMTETVSSFGQQSQREEEGGGESDCVSERHVESSREIAGMVLFGTTNTIFDDMSLSDHQSDRDHNVSGTETESSEMENADLSFGGNDLHEAASEEEVVAKSEQRLGMRVDADAPADREGFAT